MGGAVMGRRGEWLVLVLCGSCADTSIRAIGADAAVDARPVSADVFAVSMDSAAARCGNTTISPNSIPVRGDVRGAKLNAVVCDRGLETVFLGPGQAGPAKFTQSFSTAYAAPGTVAQNFQFTLPAVVHSATLTAAVDTASAAVGAYASDQQCGWIRFEVRLPIPSGVVCRAPFAPCDPGCDGYGEMAVCQPGHPRRIYVARTGMCPTSGETGIGAWLLSISAIVPHVVPDTLIRYATHGHLSATLVNETDPLDTVVIEFDF